MNHQNYMVKLTQRRILRVFLSVMMLLPWTGCASIVCGGTQEIHFSSTPSGAKVFVDGMPRGQAPSLVSLARNTSHTVRFTLEGYDDSHALLTRKINGWVWGNIIFGWLIGFIIDTATGAASELTPSTVHVNMTASEGA